MLFYLLNTIHMGELINRRLEVLKNQFISLFSSFPSCLARIISPLTLILRPFYKQRLSLLPSHFMASHLLPFIPPLLSSTLWPPQYIPARTGPLFGGGVQGRLRFLLNNIQAEIDEPLFISCPLIRSPSPRWHRDELRWNTAYTCCCDLMKLWSIGFPALQETAAQNSEQESLIFSLVGVMQQRHMAQSYTFKGWGRQQDRCTWSKKARFITLGLQLMRS